MELHDQIRIGREAKGMTREELAASMVPRVSEQAVIYWEDGTNIPRMPRLKQLEKNIGLAIQYYGSIASRQQSRRCQG
jgi:ribosome-binding protein aMBF1 (putative translation factor)